MAAPTYNGAQIGATDAGGAWSYNLSTGIGDVYIVQVLQDGATSGAVAATTFGAGVANLAGTTSAMDYLGEFPVGASSEALQHLWIGRGVAAGGSIAGTNSTSEDLYIRQYRFATVRTIAGGGISVATVIENGTAGATVNSTGTSTTVADASVTTLGADRLAVNLVAANDDIALDAFTGQSGGTWVEAVAEYAEASGTDGAIQLQTAAMASAGTIDGGTDTIVSAAWGVVGFALIGTTAGVPNTNANAGVATGTGAAI